jgi:glutamine amidotransferase
MVLKATPNLAMLICSFAGTDSEHLAALYMSYLTSYSSSPDSFEIVYPAARMADAMRDTITTVINLQLEILGSKAAPNSLNLCATDGTRLIACRFRNHATEQPPSLYYSTKAGMTLNRKYPDVASGLDVKGRYEGRSVEEHGAHLIVASEPSTYKSEDWELIGKNQFVVAENGGEFEVKDVPYDEKWNVVDPNA